MCTSISEKARVSGSAKGAGSWLSLDHVYLGYDHPSHARLEHAVLLDFVNEAAGPGSRVAVELTRDSARALAMRLLATVEEADAYERQAEILASAGGVQH